jgi:UDP-N-acetylglucosamine 1-carboxyvinyltransferase
MKKLEVFGATKLKGQIRISGSKNASLPILAATLLSNKKISLTNLPRVKDIETMLLLLKSLGSSIEDNKKKSSLEITSKKKSLLHIVWLKL